MAVNIPVLFQNLGKILKHAKAISDQQRTFAPTGATHTTGLREIFGAIATNNTALNAAMLSSIADEDAIGEYGAPTLRALHEAGRRLIIETVDQQTPLANKTIENALTELAVQMVEQQYYFDLNDVACTTSARSSNVGTGGPVVTMYAPIFIGRGQMLANGGTPYRQECQFIRNESPALTCYEDAGMGVADGQEGFVLEPARAYDRFSRRWRGGTGGRHLMRATSGSVYASSVPGQNMVYNGDFERFTVANTPDNWTITTGSAGSTVVSTATAARGSSALSFVGDGATAHKLRQPFGSTTGTAARLEGDTVYCVSCWVRSNAGTPGKTLAVGIVDSGGTTQCVANLTTVTSASITVGTTYQQFSGELHTKQSIAFPSYLQLYITGTALGVGENYYIDELVFAKPARPTKGAFGVIIPAGPTSYRLADRFNLAVTNDDASTWFYWLDWLCNTYESGHVFPTTAAAGTNIADTYITS